MNGILLLDSGCTPLRIISIQRAVILLLGGRAEPMTDEVVAEMRSPSITVPIPAVVRLGYAVKIPFKREVVPCTRRGVLVRDGHVCQIVRHGVPCEAHADTVDHVIPKSRGGANMDWKNLVSSCARCNHMKRDMTMKALGWTLKREPVAPKSQLRLLSAGAQVPASWAPFLSAL